MPPKRKVTLRFADNERILVWRTATLAAAIQQLAHISRLPLPDGWDWTQLDVEQVPTSDLSEAYACTLVANRYSERAQTELDAAVYSEAERIARKEHWRL